MNVKVIPYIIYRSVLSLYVVCLLGCSPDVEEPAFKRTVLVYMSADNSLSHFSHTNMESILKGAANDYLNGGNLLIYTDPVDDVPQLVEVEKGAGGVIGKKIVKTYPEQNSASQEVMRSVIDEVFSSGQYVADSYGLILWSHGSAWLPSDYADYLRSFGQDGNSHMEINVLKETLPDHVFDFIIFDACYMASVEVAYALRDKAGYIMASPTEILGEGLPYQQIVRYLFANEPVHQLLTRIGLTFYTYYNEQQAGTAYPASASISVVRTEALQELKEVCKAIFPGKEEEIFQLDVSTLQRLDYLSANFKYNALYDFGDFVSHLASTEAYSRYLESMKKVIVYKETTEKAYYGAGGGTTFPIDKSRFCGISSYVPQRPLAALNEWYKQLDWYKAVYEE
ncbi:MAG: hypothetical protein LBQ39_00425 [Tannerellaceae bacterium]|nr:hypothetical protein [Tannerellaceae bacterium]